MEVVRLSAVDTAAATLELSGIYSAGTIDVAGLRRALRDPDFVLLVARRDGVAAGYLHGAVLDRVDGGRMFLIYDLEIAQEHRRYGLATALMAEARKAARERDATETWLVTENDNTEAVALYESLGGKQFSAVGYEWSEP